MKDEQGCCAYERLYGVQFEHLRGGLEELKERVGQLEVTLARGVLLLVANLVGVAITLARQLVSM